MKKQAINKGREQPPRDGCARNVDYYGAGDSCDYTPPFNCEECMYGPNAPIGKNPQAKKWHKGGN